MNAPIPATVKAAYGAAAFVWRRNAIVDAAEKARATVAARNNRSRSSIARLYY